jgi:outer membrane receptor protein involved in Fe transport
VDYTHIRKTDNITQFQLQDIIDNERLVPGRVVRGPVPPGDPFGVGPITLVDLSLVNISRALVEAYDAAFDYDWATATRGRFEFFALATWQTHYQTQLLPGQPIVENVGIGNINPLRLKANAGLTWKYRSWAWGWVSHYFDSYIVSTDLTTILNQGSSRIPSQTYHDAFARWSPSADVRTTLFSNTEVQVGVKNVFNTKPPLDQSFGFALYSPFGDPRLASYYVQVKKSF